MNETSLSKLIDYYYTRRGLVWPDDADTALQWAQTELAEAYEILLSRKNAWVRNNPGDHPSKFDKQALGEELGDAIMMLVVAGIVEGIDPIECLVDKVEKKLDEIRLEDFQEILDKVIDV